MDSLTFPSFWHMKGRVSVQLLTRQAWDCGERTQLRFNRNHTVTSKTTRTTFQFQSLTWLWRNSGQLSLSHQFALTHNAMCFLFIWIKGKPSIESVCISWKRADCVTQTHVPPQSRRRRTFPEWAERVAFGPSRWRWRVSRLSTWRWWSSCLDCADQSRRPKNCHLMEYDTQEDFGIC